MSKINFGSLAAEREKQVLEFVKMFDDRTFNPDIICDKLFEGRKVPQKVYEAYRVACEDLRRKEIFKGIGDNELVLNDGQ